ncbi:MAG: S1 RNA-binding domain-containing protein, partial [Leptolyngbyaceae cyanobacterium SU_3_3]|nr:S1 RNA-binding domain-containing protein [Leptolyngbyaceae cyanobacterium SU_3_3]
IGVGQYQHDVDQKLLKKKLDETVESCVNYVGVDLNTASKELLTFVSGISPTIANNIVAYRNQNGAFCDRKALLKVPKLGPKTFEQAAGFLRIRGGKNPLDNTAVHPESYGVVEAIAKNFSVSLAQTSEIAQRLKANLSQYVTEAIGEPTLRDIVSELEKPGRDPRAEFTYATFKAGIKEISDLQVGMELEGVVTNVANFGAFVDVGVHQDGLIHVSQLADRFVSDPKQIVKVGQVVKVRVMEVNEKLKRISLSMKSPDRTGTQTVRQSEAQPIHKQKTQPKQNHSETKPPTLDDLRSKFGKKH